VNAAIAAADRRVATLAAADPVAPARRSPQAAAKAASARTAAGQAAHSLEDLLTELGTLCRNTIRIGNSRYTFTRLTTPTELQASPSSTSASNPPASRQQTARPERPNPSRSGRFRAFTPKTSG